MRGRDYDVITIRIDAGSDDEFDQPILYDFLSDIFYYWLFGSDGGIALDQRYVGSASLRGRAAQVPAIGLVSIARSSCIFV